HRRGPVQTRSAHDVSAPRRRISSGHQPGLMNRADSRGHFVLATAGHVDHGKSALVKALTGIDPDRLPEEKARGITIDLGFAHLDLQSSANGQSITFRV